MAQKHKAATEVTIATTEESPLQEFVRRYWKLGAVAAVAITGVVLGSQYVKQKAARGRAQSWEVFGQSVDFGSGPFAMIQTPSAGVLESLAQEINGTPAGPWARALQAQALIDEGDYSGASDVLLLLEEEYPDHILTKEVFKFSEEGSAENLRDHLVINMAGIEQWEKDQEPLFKNEPVPADAPKVALNTSKGRILLGLYEGRAPKHVENFLKLCGEGFYNGLLFHRVQSGFMIQGGDPNTRDGDPATWGQGGPDYKLDPETSDLRHFPYVLAAAKSPADVESSGSQFYITTGSPHHLDGVHTIFGAVIDGKSVVDEIASGAIADNTADRPRDPVVIESAEVLE